MIYVKPQISHPSLRPSPKTLPSSFLRLHYILELWVLKRYGETASGVTGREFIGRPGHSPSCPLLPGLPLYYDLVPGESPSVGVFVHVSVLTIKSRWRFDVCCRTTTAMLKFSRKRATASRKRAWKTTNIICTSLRSRTCTRDTCSALRCTTITVSVADENCVDTRTWKGEG